MGTVAVRRPSKAEEPAFPPIHVLLKALSAQYGLGTEVATEALQRALTAAIRHRYPGCEVVVECDKGQPVVRVQTVDGWRQVPLNSRELGRREARVAAQVLRHHLTEARRELQLRQADEAAGKAVEIEVVRRVRGGWEVLVHLAAPVSGFLPVGEALPGERFEPGIRAWALVYGSADPPYAALVSRRDRRLVHRLLERHVPEVADGRILVVSIAREPGVGCKVALRSQIPQLDAVGAAVGRAGARQRALSKDLGEPVEFCAWPEGLDVAGQVAAAMTPAEVLAVDVRERGDGAHAVVWVPRDQIGLALGRHGGRVRLVAQLCGLRDLRVLPSDSLERRYWKGVYEHAGAG